MAREIENVKADYGKSQSEWIDFWLKSQEEAAARGENVDELLPDE
jgi:hypothetical protein